MVSKHYGESWCHEHLADQGLAQLLEKVDTDLVEEAQFNGCLLCGGKLHRSDYERKPRSGPQWDVRFSLCCAREGCRRRHIRWSAGALERWRQWWLGIFPECFFWRVACVRLMTPLCDKTLFLSLCLCF